jgi:hypothetical protein
MKISQFALDTFRLYDSNLVNVFSINQIAKKLGKPYAYVNNHTRRLIDQGLLSKIEIGRSHMCALNFSNEETMILLCLMEIEKKQGQASQEIDAFLEKKTFTVHFVLSAGGRLIFVIEDLRHRLEIQERFSESLVLTIPEFSNYLVETEVIFKSHVIFYGCQRFFEVVKRSLRELQNKHSPLRY